MTASLIGVYAVLISLKFNRRAQPYLQHYAERDEHAIRAGADLGTTADDLIL